MTANLNAASISAAVNTAAREAQSADYVAELSLNNGGSFIPVTELTVEQVKLALELIAGRGDDTCREAAHNSLESDNERAFLAAYCAAYEGLYDERVVFG